EAEEQQRECEVLGVCRNRVLPDVLSEFGDIECAGARLQIKGNQSNQSDQGSDAQVKGDLEGGIVLLLSPAPHANHNKRRHQRQLMEEVKEEKVERGEGAPDAARHHQQQDVKL